MFESHKIQTFQTLGSLNGLSNLRAPKLVELTQFDPDIQLLKKETVRDNVEFHLKIDLQIIFHKQKAANRFSEHKQSNYTYLRNGW